MSHTGTDPKRRTSSKSSSADVTNLSIHRAPGTRSKSANQYHGTFTSTAQEHSLDASLRSTNNSSKSENLYGYSNTSSSKTPDNNSRSRHTDHSQGRKERDMSPTLCEKKHSTTRAETANRAIRPSSSSENDRKSFEATKTTKSGNIPNCAVAMRGNPSDTNSTSPNIKSSVTVAKRYTDKSTNAVSISDFDRALNVGQSTRDANYQKKTHYAGGFRNYRRTDTNKSSEYHNKQPGSTRTSIDNNNDTRSGGTVLNKSDGKDITQFDSLTLKRYKDTPLNRKLDRVGLPIGTKVFSSLTGTITTNVYSDTPENRRRGRVGMPLGSMPKGYTSMAEKCPETMEKVMDPGHSIKATEARRNKSADESSKVTSRGDVYLRNRELAEHSWLTTGESRRTDMSLLADYNGKRIDFDDLKLHSIIGQGEFGEVYVAKLREVVVAVKKMRVDNITEKGVTSFTQEVMNNCKLNHPNIVTFIGACAVMPNLCIVMEYMRFSLHDAIHLQGIEFTEGEKLDIMQQVCKGMNYLHEKRIAHCDVKSTNILLDYVEDKICEVKITDLGLSMMRPDLLLSLSQAESYELTQYRGTPRYSAPEILRGEFIGIRDMMHADVYSLGLVVYEIIYEVQPYHDFTIIQMREDVGEKGITPEIPGEFMIDKDILDVMSKTWNFEPCLRPKVRKILTVLNKKSSLFNEE